MIYENNMEKEFFTNAIEIKEEDLEIKERLKEHINNKLKEKMIITELKEILSEIDAA